MTITRKNTMNTNTNKKHTDRDATTTVILRQIARDLANAHVCDPLVNAEEVCGDDADGFEHDVLLVALQEAGQASGEASREQLRELLRRELRAFAQAITA
jgi:hypothetical protein